jgi:PII-like signaling protein
MQDTLLPTKELLDSMALLSSFARTTSGLLGLVLLRGLLGFASSHFENDKLFRWINVQNGV